MATGGIGDSERHLSECVVCLEVYVDPKLLPCDHSFCGGCVDRITTDGYVKCPMCQHIHDVTHVRADFRLAQFLDALTEKRTSIAEEAPQERTEHEQDNAAPAGR